MKNTVKIGLSNLMSLAAIAGAMAATGCAAEGAQESDQGEDIGVADQAVAIGSNSPDYFQCASEYGTCAVPGFFGGMVAFGDLASNRFSYQNSGSAATIGCNVATFGDPAPGVDKKCYVASMGFVTSEGGSSTSGRGTVAYGGNGSFFFKELGAGASYTCDNATFGDPAPHQVKDCYQMIPDYVYMAREYQTLTGLAANTPVAFGANGKYLFALASGTKACTVAGFGGDPAPGVDKSCYEFLEAPLVADEGSSYSLHAILPGSDYFEVYYGSGLNGIFMLGEAQYGDCTNTGFGGDPHPRATKHCWGREHVIF